MTVLLIRYNESNPNSSYPLFGPFGIAFYDVDEGNIVDKTTYAVKIVLSVCLSVSMVLSLIGNVSTCIVIVKDRSMRTPTNCYLVNLAITDLMISVFIPIDLYIVWMPDFYPLGSTGCRLHFILLDLFCNCNFLIITAFTFERYIVVTKPFLRQKLLHNSRVFKIVGFIWVISLFFCLPDIFYINLLERKKYVFCYYTLSDIPSFIMGIEVILFCIIPMSLILILYVLIVIELKSQQNKLRGSPINAKQNRDKAAKMLAAVATSSVFFWFPYSVLRVMMIFPNFDYEDNVTAWKIVNLLCYNGYLSTAVNPILYSLMSRKFRKAFKVLLNGGRTSQRCGRKRSLIPQQNLDITSAKTTP